MRTDKKQDAAAKTPGKKIRRKKLKNIKNGKISEDFSIKKPENAKNERIDKLFSFSSIFVHHFAQKMRYDGSTEESTPFFLFIRFRRKRTAEANSFLPSFFREARFERTGLLRYRGASSRQTWDTNSRAAPERRAPLAVAMPISRYWCTSKGFQVTR